MQMRARALLALQLAAMIAIPVLLSSCTGDDEAPVSSPTATTSAASPTPGGGGGDILVSPTIVPPPSPPVNTAVPSDWVTYIDPKGRFTFRYPADMYAEPGDVTGYLFSGGKPRLDDPVFPREGFKIEVIAAPKNQAEARPQEASSAALGGITGWQTVYAFDPSTTGGKARIHTFAVDRGDIRFFLIGYFGADVKTEDTFLLVAATFSFTDKAAG